MKKPVLKTLGTIILSLVLIYSLIKNQGNFQLLFVAVTSYIILVFSIWKEKQ